MNNDYTFGLVLGALWGIACGVYIVAPSLARSKEQRRYEVQRAVREALDQQRLADAFRAAQSTQEAGQ